MNKSEYKNTEKRSLLGTAPTATGRTVKGLAARFNSRSENLGTTERPVYEIISPGAFDGRLTDDITCLFNHEPNLILARSRGGKGTLRLWVDTVGLWYEFQAPQTQAGNDLLESIKRGDVTSSSFAFKVADGGDKYTPEGNGTLRTISKISRLYDVSAVTTPAYEETSVSARSKTAPQEHYTVSHHRRILDIIAR